MGCCQHSIASVFFSTGGLSVITAEIGIAEEICDGTQTGVLPGNVTDLVLKEEVAMAEKKKHASSEHHQSAASHHEAAAHHHRQAAHHHDQGNHDEAKKHAASAQEHSDSGQKHSKTASEQSHK
jgi:hypothetical protein